MAVLALASGGGYSTASEVQSLSVQPARIVLNGADDCQQIILSMTLANGRQLDLTADARYEVDDPTVARVTAGGRVIPLGDGATTITARHGDHQVRLTCTVANTRINSPINFPNQVVPIFTKLGCNSGGCHGKASGQNGFRLSLLGFEPELDFLSLVKEARGRRVFPAAPEKSLLLLKATAQLPHGGGKKLEKDSDEYRLVRRWIAAGMPYGKPEDPTVTRISVFPERRILARQNRQQMAVSAHYSDGRVEDITRRAQFESNDTEIATVDPEGLVQTHAASGESAIMVRYQGHVTTFRATVPLDGPTPNYSFPARTLVDQYTHQKFQLLNLVPSELCTDEEFIRRVSLDICGTLPTPAEVRAFLADPDPDKRDRLVDDLLERPEYSYLFANKWADILRVKRRGQPQRAHGTFAFHDWIRQAIAADKPYDRFVREIVAASGDELSHPPTIWYRELQTFEQFVDDTAQVFLGLRLACAQCHHHPYEKWSQDDYWGLAAFYGRVGRKQVNLPGGFQNQPYQVTRIFVRPNGNVPNKRTNQPAKIKALDAPPGSRRWRRSAPAARRLDGGRRQPLLCAGGGQPVLGPFPGPRHR
jgi:hypothetical protein